jgi:hypothetical protein
LAHATPATNGANFSWAATHPGAALALEVTENADVGANTNATSAVAITVPNTKTLKVTTGFTLGVAGTFVATGAGTVETAGTGKISLANAVAATNAANFVWATAKAGTLLALELANAATLGASAEIKVGTTVTLASGVAFAIPDTNTPVLTVKGVLDATAGTVAVGGATNKVTFDKAHITGDNSVGVILTGSAGTAEFAANDILVLAATGTIATAGSGTATFGATEFSSETDGTWTASGTGSGTGSGDPVNGVKITSAAADAGAIIAVGSTTATGWDAAILTATGTDPVITQAAETGNNLSIGAGVTIALGGAAAKVGAIVLKNSSASDALANGKLTLTDDTSKITTGNAAATEQAAGAPLADDSTTEVTNATTYAQVGVLLLTGDGTNAKIAASNNPESDGQTSNAGKIAALFGTSSNAGTITGGDGTSDTTGTSDGVISGATVTVADNT